MLRGSSRASPPPRSKPKAPSLRSRRPIKVAEHKEAVGASRRLPLLVWRHSCWFEYPYRNADWRNTVSDNPLRIIQEFNNTDKHRPLAVVVSAAHIPGQIYFSGKMADTTVAQLVPERMRAPCITPMIPDQPATVMKSAQDGT
jgi:hypothetical protein